MVSSVPACRNLEERRAVGPEEALWPSDLGRDGTAWKGMTEDFSFRASNKLCEKWSSSCCVLLGVQLCTEVAFVYQFGFTSFWCYFFLRIGV